MIFSRAIQGPEGPICLPDGSWVISEMNTGFVSKIDPDGSSKREIAYTGRPLGIALRGDGSLWVAEANNPALLRITLNGIVTSILKGNDKMPFLWPNDLCFGPDGAIYMTDSGALVSVIEGIQPPATAYEQQVDGRVFRIDTDTGEVSLLDRGLRFANGIAFGPSGNDLYVAETYTGNIYRYKIHSGHVNGSREVFANVMIKPPIEYGRVTGPDGMAFDSEGNLYVAIFGQGEVSILDTNGIVVERLLIDGSSPTNVAFTRPGEKRLLITECEKGQLIMVDVPFDGMPLYK